MLVELTRNQLLLVDTVAALERRHQGPFTTEEVCAYTPSLTEEAINEALESSPELAKALDGILARPEREV